MAKGKKATGKHYVSAGTVGTNRALSKAMRRERDAADVFRNKLKGYLAGNNAYITIDNPNPNETNKRKIRVSLHSIFGGPKAYRSSTLVIN
jgi:hypothetical protein